MRQRLTLTLIGLVLIACSAILPSCSPSRYLKDGEYMLTKNNVKVVDSKNVLFDDLYYIVRPVTNKKFLEIYPLKAARYVNHLPVTDSAGNVIKDTKFMQKRRENGEPLVMLDTSMIEYSLDQIYTAMHNWGYFEARAWDTIVYKDPNRMHPGRHKAEVTYFVEAGNPYHIRDIQYHVEIVEYRRIILSDTSNCVIHSGDRYDADKLLEERDRMVSNIRDNGYYHVSNEIVSFKIDTLDARRYLDKKGHKTLVVHIYVNFDRISDPEVKERHAYKYYFNNVVVYPNYDPTSQWPTQRTTYHRSRTDKTNYTIIGTNFDSIPKRTLDRPIPDIRPRILVDNILTKKGLPYSQTLVSRSRKKLNDLRNFSYINIVVEEDVSKRDTVNRTGQLNTYYYMRRNKLHSLSAEIEARSDKADLSLTYSNKNLFHSAEHFSINVYGGIGFRIRTKTKEHPAGFTLENKEIGAEISMNFRRLLFFRKTQKIEANSYGTLLKIGAHYEDNYLYRRGLYNAALVYNWSYNNYLSHSLSPIDLSIINITPKGDEFYEVMRLYSKDFQSKYEDNILLSAKYGLTYTHPFSNPRNRLTLRLKMESSGMLLTGICAMAKAPKDEYGNYLIGKRNYGNFEMAELDLRYSYNINNKNSIATRFNFGIGVPLFGSRTLPFEKSFYLGGSNSMRGWPYRTLGPGSYYNDADESLIQDIRTGDMKVELNLEYRGTLYKFIKYGIFADAGNIWLMRKDDDMPNAEFKINRFYKEIGLAAGVGLRFDFNFFIIRVDAALPIYDPGHAEGDKWIGLTVNDKGNTILNRSINFLFGIGHAF